MLVFRAQAKMPDINDIRKQSAKHLFPDESQEQKAQKLDVNTGATIALDHLGPIVGKGMNSLLQQSSSLMQVAVCRVTCD